MAHIHMLLADAYYCITKMFLILYTIFNNISFVLYSIFGCVVMRFGHLETEYWPKMITMCGVIFYRYYIVTTFVKIMVLLIKCEI